MANPNSIEARDIAYVMHGNTNLKKHREVGPMVMEKGDGVYVIDTNGKRYIEAMAGLWSVGVGFSEKRLVEAATRQMEQLPYYHAFGGKSYGPMIDLAEKLVTMSPVPMSKAFFTNSGSEANDTVLKFLWYRANAMGQPLKKKMITRARAYHGITIAASSLTGLPNNHRSFDLIVPDVIRLTCPHHYHDALPGESEEDFATRLADELEQKIIEEGPETICAFIGEPVMGAGGVVVPPATYWPKMQAVLKKYDILLIADEVICGFGRTGKMFACETYGIEPDVLVLSKQIVSSYLPLAAILFNDKVLDPIVEESDRIGVLGHGFTAGGHPVAAAVALENLAIIEERDLVGNAAAMGERLMKGLGALKDHPLVGEVRGVGLLWGVELVIDKAAKTGLEPTGRLGALVGAEMVTNGVIVRPVGDTVCFCPPMIINAEEIDELVARFRKSLDSVLAALTPVAA